MNRIPKDLVKEVIVIVSFSILIAFVANLMSPNGISLFGQWDTSKGVISANSKNDVIVPEREIHSHWL